MIDDARLLSSDLRHPGEETPVRVGVEVVLGSRPDDHEEETVSLRRDLERRTLIDGTYVYVCVGPEGCRALVDNADGHRDWHDQLARVIRRELLELDRRDGRRTS